MIISRTIGQPVLRHEHVLGAAEADSFGAELACLTCVGRRVRVRMHSQPAYGVGPPRIVSKSFVPAWRRELDTADDHPTGRPVDRDLLAFCNLAAADRGHPPRQSIVRLSTPATHGFPMPRATTAAWEVMPPDAVTIPCRLHEPVNVGGGRLAAHEDDALARLATLFGRVGVEHEHPTRRPGRGVQTGRGDIHLRRRVEHRVEQLVELGGIDAPDRLFTSDQALGDHRDGRLHSRSGGPLRRAGLQQVETAILDRELDVLHVAVVTLEPVDGADELGIRLGHQQRQLVDRLRRADPRDDVLPLRVEKELAVEPTLAR